MKSLIITLLVSVLVSLPCIAVAQPESAPSSIPISQVDLLELPKGTRLKTSQGTFHGYSLEEFKVILKIDKSYRSWGLQIPLYKKITNDYKLLIENKDKQIKLSKNNVVTLKTDRDRLAKKWAEDNRLRHICENKPNFGSWISWSLVAVVTATAAVLAGIIAARD